jgi:hypothetical protein
MSARMAAWSECEARKSSSASERGRASVGDNLKRGDGDGSSSIGEQVNRVYCSRAGVAARLAAAPGDELVAISLSPYHYGAVFERPR